MEKNEFRDFQLYQLRLLDEFARICDQNELTYYLIGGTLLGAVRHKGFIPWDPDIDVAMMRKDYDKFIEIAKTQLDKNKYFLATFRNEKDHYSPHILLHSQDVCIVNPRLQTSRNHKGIYLDIFPLDDAPDSLEDQNKQAKQLRRIRRIIYYKQAIIHEPNPPKIKIFMKHVIKVILSFLSLKLLQSKLERVMTKHDCGGTSKIVGHMASHYKYHKVLFERQIYGNPRKVMFEGKYYSAPSEIDFYLKQYYGDYMELPSIEKQETFYDAYKHVSFIIINNK